MAVNFINLRKRKDSAYALGEVVEKAPVDIEIREAGLPNNLTVTSCSE